MLHLHFFSQLLSLWWWRKVRIIGVFAAETIWFGSHFRSQHCFLLSRSAASCSSPALVKSPSQLNYKAEDAKPCRVSTPEVFCNFQQRSLKHDSVVLFICHRIMIPVRPDYNMSISYIYMHRLQRPHRNVPRDFCLVGLVLSQMSWGYTHDDTYPLAICCIAMENGHRNI